MIRPILIETVHANTVGMWATVAAHFIVFGIFLFIAWLICNKSMRGKKAYSSIVFCLSTVVGLILLLLSGVTLVTVKGMILTLLLLYASISDLDTRKVSDCISVMILILAFVGFEAASLPSMLLGALVVFVPQFALAIIRPSRACGGADLKISTALAFLLGAEKGIFALIVGMLLAVIVMAIYNKANAKDQKEAFPLVPFLSIGALLSFII